MGLGILGDGGVYDVYCAAVVNGQICVGAVIYGVVPFGEEHYALSAGHFEKGRGKLTAVFEIGNKAIVLTDMLYKGAELLFNVAVKMEEVGVFQVRKVFNILVIYIGVKHAAARVCETAHGEAILHGRMEFVAYDYIQLACLKLGEKVGDRAALKA